MLVINVELWEICWCRESKWDIVGRFWDKCGSYGNGIRNPMDGIPPKMGFVKLGIQPAMGRCRMISIFLDFG